MQLRAHSTHIYTLYTYTPESYCGSETNLSNRKTTRFVDVFMYTHAHCMIYTEGKKNNRKTTIANRNRRAFYYIHIVGDRCVFLSFRKASK